MSEHFIPFERQVEFGSLQDLVHEQETSYKSAVDAGWPPIHSIPSLFSSYAQPCLPGLNFLAVFKTSSSDCCLVVCPACMLVQAISTRW